MPENRTGDSGADGANPNIGSLGQSAVESALSYLQARLLLLRIESKEASSDVALRAVLIFSAGSLFTFSYLVAMTAGISLLAEYLETRWEHVALCAAGAHSLIGLIVFFIARARFSRPLFEWSLKELDKDLQWLQDRKTR